MSKDTEENVRYKLEQTIEDRKKKSANTIYPTTVNGKESKEEVKEQIKKIMTEIDEFERSDEVKMEIKFTELYDENSSKS